VAGSDWILVVVAFVALQHAGWGMTAEGADLAAAFTAPWSLVIIAGYVHSAPPASLLPGTLGIFFLFPLISGGINSFIIYWLVYAIQRRRGRKALPL
jgi:hypothetical protein